MRKQLQSHIIAFVGTLVSLFLIFLLLWYLTMSAPVLFEDEGIVISFGEIEMGGEPAEGAALDELAQMEQLPERTEAALPSDNEWIVQEDDESLVLAKQAEEQAKRHAEEEQLRKRQEEHARMEAERLAKEKALAEQKAKEREAMDLVNKAFAGLQGQSTNQQGGNSTNKNEGDVSSLGTLVKAVNERNGGIQCSLDGRKLRYLPEPSKDFTQEGKVVVRIMVDKEGNVVDAKVIDAVVDRYTQQLALQAAKQTKFSEGESSQIGEITYIFKLN